MLRTAFLLRNCPKANFAALRRLKHGQANFEIWSSVCVERKPLCALPLTKVEQDYAELQNVLDIENSHKSDHELRMEADKVRANRKLDEDYEESEAEMVLQTAAEAQDEWDAQLEAFKQTNPNFLSNNDDNTDMSCPRRAAHRSLYMLVRNLPSKHGPQYSLPRARWQQRESLRDTAQRAVTETCSDAVRTRILGRAPRSHMTYRYPKPLSAETGADGATWFIFKAQTVKLEDSIQDAIWVTQEELKDKVDTQTYRSVKPLFLEI